MPEQSDVAVIGAGIVGLATAYQLLERFPGLRITIVDKELEVAAHQSSHNSGVLHAGLYYPAGSLRARLCRSGKAEMEAFADRHEIPYRRCGKLIVATKTGELPLLQEIRERALSNGVTDLEEVGLERMHEIEPHATGIRGLWSPGSAIIDFGQVARALGVEVEARGASILLGRRVTAIRSRVGALVLSTTGGELLTRAVIACAGLWSDRVAALTGDAGDERIIPFRGDYYTLQPAAADLVRGLVYPVPDPHFPFLGVHFTRRIDGSVWAGPNAVLAFSREGYRRTDLHMGHLAETLAWPGFRTLARRHLRTGLAELWRDWSKAAFLRALQQYIPDIESSDLRWGPSGVRAQSVRRDGTLVDDFSIGASERVIHLRNAASPAATASFAIGREIATMAAERFGLAASPPAVRTLVTSPRWRMRSREG